MNTNDKNILFYDGDCAFCNFWVKWLIKRDKKHVFYFASQDSKIAKKMVLDNIDELNSLILIYKNNVYTKSRAVAILLSELGFFYRILSTLLMIVPVCWADRIYTFVANNRFLTGKASCSLQDFEIFKPYILN
jgi:predicted DCC family thiol-disulfide oxidoreductase YuxK